MKNLIELARSSIGTKFVMAGTGVILLGFVIMHMLGNLQIFLGEDALNHYAATLKTMPALIWGARTVLMLALLSHLGAALKLTKKNSDARPVSYAYEATIQATPASRSMLVSGIVVLLYVFALHLPHFTLHLYDGGVFKTLHDHAGRHGTYEMVVRGFSSWPMSAIYILAMIGLGLHLSHGISSVVQTLGISHPSYNCAIRAAGPVIATLIVVGYIVVPIAVLIGVLPLPAPPGGV